jgi:hypothetical protein
MAGRRVRRRLSSAIVTVAVVAAAPARALDKQGSAHGGEVGAEPGHETEFNVSGAATLGVSLVNQTYAARPDNTGLALMRYATHFDVDLVGRRLSIPIDLNFFSDRTRKGALVFSPTEFDVIGGLTTTNAVAKGADLELGARVEDDRPVDRGGFTQTYADARARLLYSLAKIWPSLGRDLVDGDLSGWATLGWFAVNPSYAARPDNSGLALLRYAAHSELSVWKDHLSLGLDGTMFTDRDAKNVLRPSELDATYEIIGRSDPFEVHLAYERDMPIDRGGLVQSFVYVLFVYDFDLRHDVLDPLEKRGSIPSP